MCEYQVQHLINEQIILWQEASMKGVVTTHFPISEKWTTLSPKLLHSSVRRYNVISSYVNTYFHLDYPFMDKVEVCVDKQIHIEIAEITCSCPYTH